MNSLAALARASSLLSNTPKPQMPPCRLGTPSSAGKAIGNTSKPSASALLTSWVAFQQKAIWKVPLTKFWISSLATIAGSKVMPSWAQSAASALAFSSEAYVYSVCSALA